MFFRDYYFSSGNSRVNRLIALFRCIVGLMKQICLLAISCFDQELMGLMIDTQPGYS